MAVSPVPRRARILIAEERAPLSERLSGIVEKAGFEPVVVYSGQVVLSQVRALLPEVVILSDQIGPPGASETARRIKEDPTTGAIPIIMLSSSVGEEDAASESYPVEACLALSSDEASLTNLIRLLARGTSRRPRAYGASVGSLEGSLRGSPLSEILQFLFLTGKAGRVTVTEGDRHGSIYFGAGTVLHADFEEARGTDAFFHACFLGRGEFRFEPGVKAPEPTMRESGVELLLEAARRLDVSRQNHDSGERRLEEIQAEPIARRRPRSDVGPPDYESVLTAVLPSSADTLPYKSRKSATSFRPAVTTETTIPWQAPTTARTPWPNKSGVLVAALVAAALFGAFMVGRFFPIREIVKTGVATDALPWERHRFPLSVTTNPNGARLLVDGHEVGVTPVSDLMLQSGRYLVRVERDGYKPYQTHVGVGSGEASRDLRYELQPEVPNPLGTLRLRVVPAGAVVFADGEKLDPSPHPVQLEPGNHRIEARLPGFETWTGQVELEPNAVTELAVTLKRLRAAPPENLPNKVAADALSAPVEPASVAEPPQRISGRYPSYPAKFARGGKKLTGTVVVEIQVDERGNVASTRLVESAGEALDEAVLSAVRDWKYRPATREGRPERATVQYRHLFR